MNPVEGFKFLAHADIHIRYPTGQASYLQLLLILQIVVTATPSSIGVDQENIQPQFSFPGTANQKHIVMSSNPDDFELDEEVERVKAEFQRKMKAAMIKLKSIFRMYQVDKFSASILKANKDDWLKRVETHAEDAQELVVSFLDNVFITERDQTEADNLLDQFMISVSNYMLAYHTKIGSGVQTAGGSNSLSASHEPRSSSASGVNQAVETAKVNVDNEAEKISMEVKVGTIGEMSDKTYLSKKRLHTTSLQTFCKLVENQINNTLICYSYGRDVNNNPILKMITPNWSLTIGWLHSRSLSGPMKYLKKVDETYKGWFEIWNVSELPNMIPQPRWFKVKQGDVIMFQKFANELSSDWPVCQIESIIRSRSKDGAIRRVEVRYHNQNDKEPKFTDRAVRSLVRLFHIEDNYYIEVDAIISDLENKAKVDEENIDKVEPLSRAQYSCVDIKRSSCPLMSMMTPPSWSSLSLSAPMMWFLMPSPHWGLGVT